MVWPPATKLAPSFSQFGMCISCKVGLPFEPANEQKMSFYTHKFSHREALTHRCFYTEKLLHREVFTQRRLYTEKLWHTEVFTRRTLYTEQTFAHNTQKLCTEKLLHGASFYTEPDFAQRSFNVHNGSRNSSSKTGISAPKL